MFGIAEVVVIGSLIDSIDEFRPSLGSAVACGSWYRACEVVTRQMHLDGQAVDELFHHACTRYRHELEFSGCIQGTRPTPSSPAVAVCDFEAVMRLGGPLVF